MDHKTRTKKLLDEISDDLIELSRWLYEHPEIAYQEHEASARLAQILRNGEFEVIHPAHGLDTAFEATVGTDGPRVVICAEYDALPGVGHACGHNIIAASALGAGAILAPIVEELGIRLTVLGTPAEEQYGGKVDLIEAGAFDDVAAAMMIHPTSTDVVDPNVIAVAHLDIDFHGKTAHASSHPQVGINALDAFVQAYVNVSTLRQSIYATDKIHGIITHGGDAPNIIPDLTTSSWYVRSNDRERLDTLLPRVLDCFHGAATATGCTVDIRHVGHTYDELLSNPTMVDLFAANAEELGRPMMRGDELPPSQAGSTDMGNVSQLVPTIHPMVSINSLPAINHQPEFAAHTLSPDGERAIYDGALAMAWTVIDLAARELWDEL